MTLDDIPISIDPRNDSKLVASGTKLRAFVLRNCKRQRNERSKRSRITRVSIESFDSRSRYTITESFASRAHTRRVPFFLSSTIARRVTKKNRYGSHEMAPLYVFVLSVSRSLLFSRSNVLLIGDRLPREDRIVHLSLLASRFIIYKKLIKKRYALYSATPR